MALVSSRARNPSNWARRLALLLILTGSPALTPATADTVVHAKDRIVFCGDSITGQGGKFPGGWVGLARDALTQAHPDWHLTVTALGASGATLGAWQNIEKKSRTQPVFLDVPKVDVKATLDGGAEIIVILLGMNDVLSPSLKNDPAAFDQWKSHYHDLIEAIKVRAHPRLFALATITPCTEDPNSPKNLVEAELNQRLAALAQEEHAIVIPTHETMMELLAAGRAYRPDFHLTGDNVHPSGGGHLAMAVGMLRGLGETDTAQQLLDKYPHAFQPDPKDLPTLSYMMDAQPGAPDDKTHGFVIHYQWTPPAGTTTPLVVTPTVPAGWTVSPTNAATANGDFTVSGPLDEAVNKITINATSGDLTRTLEIDIAAGWRIAVGQGAGLGWTNNTIYDPTKDLEPLDQTLGQDAGYLSPMVTGPAGKQITSPWQYYVPTESYNGRGAPGSIDMAAVTFFTNRNLAYGAQWIYSPRDRPVQVNLKGLGFTMNYSMTVWLNSDQLFSGKLATLPKAQTSVAAKLHTGWNRLWFRSTYIQWQWGFVIKLTGETGDDLADLRYATSPPPGTVPAPAPAAAPTLAPAPAHP